MDALDTAASRAALVADGAPVPDALAGSAEQSAAVASPGADAEGRAARVKTVTSVVVLTHGYYPRIGGIERQRAQVTPRIAATGVRATVVTRAERGAPRREMRDGVEIIRIFGFGGKTPGSAHTRAIVWRLTKPLDSALFRVGALAAVVRRRPDVIHTHEFISTAKVGLLAGRLLRTPVIVTSHRSGPLGDVGRHLQSARGRRLLDRIRTQAALALGVSEEIGGELATLGFTAERRIVVHNGVDIDVFCPVDPARRAQLRATLGLAPDAHIVLFTGRLMPEKRVDQLLALWPEITEVDPHAHLVVVGTGDEDRALRAAAPAAVTFVGAVAATAPYLQAADVFVLPSVAEGLSNALLEAQACGLPCIVTDVGAARDVVRDGENGMIVEPDQPTALGAALVTMLTSPDQAAQLGRAARVNTVAHFSIDATAAAFVDAYRDVWSRRRAER